MAILGFELRLPCYKTFKNPNKYNFKKLENEFHKDIGLE
jgi:hypothetical protein